MPSDCRQRTCCLTSDMTGTASTVTVSLEKCQFFVEILKYFLSAGGEVLLCRDCHRVYHPACVKPDLIDPTAGFVCTFCRSFQTIPSEYNKNERQDLNLLLQITVNRLKEKMPGSILSRAPPPPAKNPYLTSVSPLIRHSTWGGRVTDSFLS